MYIFRIVHQILPFFVKLGKFQKRVIFENYSENIHRLILFFHMQGNIQKYIGQSFFHKLS